ncbi:MAG: pantoate--beta-alanine ligase [Candidatus Omnitrophota bacterium]
MKVIRSVKKMAALSKKYKGRGESIGFVPTMGALHKGHISLIRNAHKGCDLVVVSIFVNPAQFSPKEDFRRYPRNLMADTNICKREGVDIIFFPDAGEMYPKNYKTYLEVDDLSQVLCGKFRPGHFRGVATVLTKLFNIVNPDFAYFGQKDALQAIITKRLVDDLNIPVKIKILPIIREMDGLAMSSRNIYLSRVQREEAAVLYQALRIAGSLIKKGNRSSKEIIRRMRLLILKKKTARIQYVSIFDLKEFKPVKRIKGRILIALAVFFGKMRLIDNVIINC